jgi:NAD(P)-dependent dehydrogenase (short-subunit alcohol dehydrogenase family)
VALQELFSLDRRVVIITGGAGLLGRQHSRIVADAGGIPVIVDRDGERAVAAASEIRREFGGAALGLRADVSSTTEVLSAREQILAQFQRIDVLINNATNNPTAAAAGTHNFTRFERFPQHQWADDIAVGLTGAFVCSQIFGSEMAARRKGVILNIASDLAIIAPDQRIYRRPGVPDNQQPVKPVTYSVVKSGLLGLTRYLATYWAAAGVRTNALSPGGVFDGQTDDFVTKLTSLIPMGRMAGVSEYQGAVLFLISDASSYMTGANLVVDGGRTCW